MAILPVASQQDAWARNNSVQDVVQVSDLSGMAESPDGKWLAVRVATPGLAQDRVRLSWWLVAADGSKQQLVADGGEPSWLPAYGTLISMPPVWATDSRAFYYTRVADGIASLWRATLAGDNEQLTHERGELLSFTLDASGQRIIFEISEELDEITRRERKEYDEGILWRPSSFIVDTLKRLQPYYHRDAMPRREIDEDRAVMAKLKRTAKLLDLESGEARPLSDAERRQYEARGRSSSPELPLIHAMRESGDLAFARPERPNEAPEGVTPSLRVGWTPVDAPDDVRICDLAACRDPRIRGVGWRPAHQEILFWKEDMEGYTDLYAWDAARNHVRRVVRADGLLGHGGAGLDMVQTSACPISARFAFCSFAGSDMPPRLERIDLDTGERRSIFEPNAPVARPRGYRVEHLTWKDKWGRPVAGVLVTPASAAGARRFPLVITGYKCGGYLRGGGLEVSEFLLAEAGIAALCVDLNLVEIWGKPHPSGKVPKGQLSHLAAMVDAWEAGIDLLHQRGLVDPTRVGVSGLSLGAEAVHYATINTRLFSVAATATSDIKDPFDYYILASQGEEGAASLRWYGMPDPAVTMDPYRATSPALNADKIDIPILIQSGEREYIYGYQYYVALQALKKPVEFHVFPDEAHLFRGPRHRAARAARNIDWFRFWLKSEEDSDPGKQEQYMRWRSLRALK